MSREPRRPEGIPDLSGRRILVTDATGAVGAEVVRVLAGHGADVHTPVVDLADQACVRREVARVAANGPVDVLVNNARVTARSYQRTVDGFERQMAVNHLGPFALTGLLLPQLAASGRGRVVTVCPPAHHLARSAPLTDPRVPPVRYRRWPVYARTSLANVLFSLELDRRLRRRGLPVLAVAAEPGFPRHPVRHAGVGILDAALTALAQPAEAAALPVVVAATADVPLPRYVGRTGPSRLARDERAARRLWELSEAATGVVYP